MSSDSSPKSSARLHLQLPLFSQDDCDDLPMSLSWPISQSYTIDRSVELIRMIQLRLMAVEDYRLKLRWCFGLVVTNTERPYGQGSEVIAEIIRRLRDDCRIQVSKTLLYECEKLFKVFDGAFPAFEAWLDETKAALGRPIYWSDIQRLLLGGRNNPDVIGQEDADRLDYLEAERAVDAIERIVMRAQEGDEEAAGVLEGMRQTIRGLELLPERRMHPPRDDDYLDFVRRFGCIVCLAPAEAHHAFGFRGMSEKPSDFTAVPLCTRHHRELHNTGTKAFAATHDIILVEIAFNLLHRHLCGQWATMVLRRTH